MVHGHKVKSRSIKDEGGGGGGGNFGVLYLGRREVLNLGERGIVT